MMPLWNHRLAGHNARNPCGLTKKHPEKGGSPPRNKCPMLAPLAPAVMGPGVSVSNKANDCCGQHIMIGGCAPRRNGYHTRHAEGSPVRPRLVTIIKPNEDGVIRKISLLLNRRAVVSFEQLLSDVSEALGFPSWNNERVRHLFTPAGQSVISLSQFFHADDAFLAVGRTRPSVISLQMALEELYPGCPGYCDELLRRWQRSMRPKASKADSGFHDVSPKENNNNNSHALNDTPSVRPNNLQPLYSTQQDRDLQEEQRRDRERRMRRRAEKLVPEGYQVKANEQSDHRLPLLPGRPGEPREQGHRQTKNKGAHTGPGSHPKPAAPKSKKANNTLHTNVPQPAQVTKSQEITSHKTPKQPPPEPSQQDAPELPDGDAVVTQVDIERFYDIGRVVGDGNFAVVHMCVERRTGLTRAMKVVDRAKLQGREHMIHNEVSLLASLKHPRVVQLLRCHHTSTHIYLIMELASEGDLFDAIVSSVKFGEGSAAGMMKDISDALHFIHSRSIVHRDIKPENLLVHRHDGAVNLKLADFGLALVVTEPLFTVCGTPTYVAPEILAETGYGIAVDVWAMGVILYILLCGFPPFRSTDRNQVELFKLIQAGDLQFPSPYWDEISEDVKDLIQGLLQVDPKQRLTAQQALQHGWIQSDGKTTDDSNTHQTPHLAVKDSSSLTQSTEEKHKLPRTSTPYRQDIRPTKTPEAAAGLQTDNSTDKTTEDEGTSVRMKESSPDQTIKHSSVLSPEEEKKTDIETSDVLTS